MVEFPERVISRGVGVWAAYRIHADILDVTGETLIQPKIRPPTWSHQVSEPLMREFVSYHGGYPLLIAAGRYAILV